MKKFNKIRNLNQLVDFGIIDFCCLDKPCPYNNMVCKSCPFSYQYRRLFVQRNAFAKIENEILKVHTASTFVNRNVFVSFNDKPSLRTFY